MKQAETAKRRAAAFEENVLDNSDRADDISAEDLTTWAEETHRTIINPQKRKTLTMPGIAATPTKQDLQDLLDETADAIREALDPALSREDVVSKLQDIDSSLDDFGSDDDDEDEDDSSDEDETDDEV